MPNLDNRNKASCEMVGFLAKFFSRLIKSLYKCAGFPKNNIMNLFHFLIFQCKMNNFFIVTYLILPQLELK